VVLESHLLDDEKIETVLGLQLVGNVLEQARQLYSPSNMTFSAQLFI
jgi:hypothetical protein